MPDPQGLFVGASGSDLENVWAEDVAHDWGDVHDLESLRAATLGG